jgi:hypothetical protein
MPEDGIPQPNPTAWAYSLLTFIIVIPILVGVGLIIGGYALDASTYSYERCEIYQVNETNPVVLEDAHKHFCDFNGTAWYFNKTRFAAIWNNAYT